MVKDYLLEDILKILNIKKNTFQSRKNKLEENLELKGYKLLEIKRDKENELYFEFGVDKNKVKIEDFEN